nr:DUF2567 domain-containing protein [Streptomyces coryli]
MTPHGPPQHGSSPDSSWPSPVAAPGAGYGLSGRELRGAALIAAGSALAGLLYGALWTWLAPRVPLIAQDGAVLLRDSESEHTIAIDGTFTLLGLGFGALAAALVFLWRRRGGVALVLALAIGGLLAALVAWRFGVWLGPPQDVAAQAKSVGEGKAFDAPLRLNAKGALLAWPVGAMIAHLILTGLFGPRDPDPQPQSPGNWQGWGQPPAS